MKLWHEISSRLQHPFNSALKLLTICIGVVLIICLYIGVFRHDQLLDALKSSTQALLFLCGSVSVVLTLNYCRKRFLELKSDIGLIADGATADAQTPEDWYDSHVGFFDFTIGNYLFGIFIGTLAVSGYILSSYISSEDYLVLVLGYGALFLSAFIAGTALWTLGRGVKFLNNLGKLFEFHLSDHQFGVLLIGRTLLKCFVAIVITVAFFQATAVVGLGIGQDFDTAFRSLPMLVLGYPVAIFLFVSFIYAQLSIHEKLRQSKKLKTREIEEKIRVIGIPDQVDGERGTELLTYLHDEMRRTLDMPEWPCSIRGIIGGGAVSVYGLVFSTFTDKAFEALSDIDSIFS